MEGRCGGWTLGIDCFNHPFFREMLTQKSSFRGEGSDMTSCTSWDWMHDLSVFSSLSQGVFSSGFFVYNGNVSGCFWFFHIQPPPDFDPQNKLQLGSKLESNKASPWHGISHLFPSSWWLNQPIWKICSSKWLHLPQFSGWTYKIFELPPPQVFLFWVTKNTWGAKVL